MKKDQQNKNGKEINNQRVDAHTNDDYKKNIQLAHEQADKDMEKDAELTARNPNDDLDEGESARLGNNADLV